MQWSQDTYQKAINFAGIAHNNQTVPGRGYSYVVHIASVCMEVMSAVSLEKKIDADLSIQCALLHDTIEDTFITYEKLLSEFGKEVSDGVLALSKDKKLVKNLQLKDSLDRIVKQPREIWMVKLADRITNLQPPPRHWTLKKRKEYKEEAILIYDTLKTSSVFLADRLNKKIADYNNY